MSDDGNEFSREFSSGLSITMGVVSGLSLACCLSVILLIYTKETLFKKNLCKFVMILMVNEMGTSVGTSLGMSTNDSFSCWIQSFLTNYFPYCQSLWLSLTAWMLNQIIFHSKSTNLICVQSFAVCSGVPLILALLPLTTQDFGNEGNFGCCHSFTTPKRHRITYHLSYITDHTTCIVNECISANLDACANNLNNVFMD